MPVRDAFVIVIGFVAWCLAAQSFAALYGTAGAAYASAAVVTVPKNEALYAELPTPAPTQPPSGDSLRLPILVYHIVRPSYPSDSAAVKALAVTPETFRAELSYLKTAGYTVIPFTRLDAYFHDGTPLPPKPIVISFDDGWSDQYAYAFPILREFGYPVTFFVFTNAIGHKGFLTWNELKEMQAAGMSIESHSESHPYLSHMTATSTLRAEIAGSKRILEAHLGTPVTEFAYPFGMVDARIIRLVQAAGYASARGDYSSTTQSKSRLYDLGGNNAPPTLQKFEQEY